MKYSLIQLVLCGLFLGMMVGAVAIHFMHVSGAREMSEAEVWSVVDAGLNEGPHFISPVGSDGSRRAAGENMQEWESMEGNAAVLALREMVSIVREMKLENRKLGQQVEATNRDLMELQFRVDTHSYSFRPMRGAADAKGSHMLLPPKAP